MAKGGIDEKEETHDAACDTGRAAGVVHRRSLVGLITGNCFIARLGSGRFCARQRECRSRGAGITMLPGFDGVRAAVAAVRAVDSASTSPRASRSTCRPHVAERPFPQLMSVERLDDELK